MPQSCDEAAGVAQELRPQDGENASAALKIPAFQDIQADDLVDAFGAACFIARDYGKAVSFYERALIRTYDSEHWYALAISLALKQPESDTLAAAVICVKNCLKANPAHLEALALVEYLSESDTEMSGLIGRVKEVLREHPGYADQHHLLGMCMMEQCRYHEALDCFNAALAINPRLTRTILQRALVLVNIGDYPQALNAFEGLTEIARANDGYLKPSINEGSHYEEQILLAREEQHSGNLPEACNVYSGLFHIAPNHASIQIKNAKILYKAGLVDLALLEVNSGLAVKPQYPDGHCLRGHIFLQWKNEDEALLAFNKAVEINPFYVEACKEAVTLWKSRNDTTAVESLKNKWKESGRSLPSWLL